MKKNNLHNNKGGFKVPENYFDQLEEKLFEKLTPEKDSSSLLDKKSESGLKIPEDYLNSFEDRLFEKLKTKDQETSSTLFEGVKSGLSVPDDYFENIEQVILNKTSSKKQAPKVIPLFSKRNVLFASGIAAMIAIIFSIFINSDNHNPSLNFEDIALADIQDYFDNEDIEFNEADITSLIDYDISFTDTFNESELSDENLLDYLSDEEIENDIINIE